MSDPIENAATAYHSQGEREFEWHRLAREFCEGVPDEYLKPGGLAALLEAARSALSILEADRECLFESCVNRRTGEVEDADEKAEIAAYDAAIEALRALLPQTGEGEATPAPVSDTDRVLADIAAERRRQVKVEGFTTEHDDEHINGELARAGALYAEYASSNMMHDAGMKIAREGRAVVGWPWEAEWFKPRDRYTDLKRATALIASEMERLLRLARRQGTAEGIGPDSLLDSFSKREDGTE